MFDVYQRVCMCVLGSDMTDRLKRGSGLQISIFFLFSFGQKIRIHLGKGFGFKEEERDVEIKNQRKKNGQIK